MGQYSRCIALGSSLLVCEARRAYGFFNTGATVCSSLQFHLRSRAVRSSLCVDARCMHMVYSYMVGSGSFCAENWAYDCDATDSRCSSSPGDLATQNFA